VSIQTYCNYKEDYYACTDDYKECFGGDIEKRLLNNVDEIFERLELNIQTKTVDDFTFQGDCS
jgi:hypothetical protein